MTDAVLQREAEAAIRDVEVALGAGEAVTHAEIRVATQAIVALRDRCIERYRAGALDREVLERANALVSLSYGAEFPLSGLHRDRLEKTRDALRALL